MTKIKEGYKETEIGVIPIEWEVSELRDIGKVSMCKRIMKNETTDYGKIPFYKIGTFGKEADAYISEEVYKEYKNKYSFPKKGDILISASGTIGRLVVYNGEPAYFQDSNIVWIDNQEDKLLNSLLFYIYKTVKWHTDGNTIARLYNENLRRIKIPLPPLKEQEKIADILSTADEKIDAIASQIQKAETLKIGLLQKLLSEGIGHSEFKDSELGKIPESWKIDGLGKVANITKLAGYEFTEHFNYEAGGDIIALRALNVVNGKLNLDSIQRVSTTISNKLPRSKLYINDILMTYVGTLGEFAIIEENDKFHLAPNVAKITMNSQEVNISKYILYYLMSNNGQKQIKLLSTTTSQPAINMENIRKIKIPLPPLKEQKQIVDILSTADEKLEVLRAKKEKYEELKKGLLQKLLSGEVRV